MRYEKIISYCVLLPAFCLVAGCNSESGDDLSDRTTYDKAITESGMSEVAVGMLSTVAAIHTGQATTFYTKDEGSGFVSTEESAVLRSRYEFGLQYRMVLVSEHGSVAGTARGLNLAESDLPEKIAEYNGFVDQALAVGLDGLAKIGVDAEE
jgi:hypothetical protein